MTKDLPNVDDLPYKSTKVSKEETMMEIIGLLEDKQISGYTWGVWKGKRLLRFIYKDKPYALPVPQIMARKTTRHTEKEIVVDEQVALRMFFWALKSTLEIARFGALDFDKLMLGYQLVSYQGELIPIAELLEKNPQLALPAPETAL